MKELYLKFKNDDGKQEKVAVGQDRFTIGRHSENDLSILSSNLSREHLKIERFAEIYVVSDCGSSNGTKLNGVELIEPETLTNGDKLDLGGGLEIEVGFTGDDANEEDSESDSVEDSHAEVDSEGSVSNSGGANSRGSSPANVQESSPFGLGKLVFVAPLLVLFILLGVVSLLLIFGGNSKSETNDPDSDFVTSTDNDADIDGDKDSDDNSTENRNSTQSTVDPANSSQQIPNSDDPIKTPLPQSISDAEKIEGPALAFLRRIARNDSNPVLTGRQLSVISAKAKQFRSSSGLASNIRDARKNAAGIESLARSKNLKPQFLANAALTKLGSSRGNVVATAQGMLGVLDNLTISLGDELANDTLLVIAAFDQGVAGRNLAMRDTVASLARKNPNVSSRQVRTIWFLRDKGKLTNTQFEFVLRFLAIGAITQNPKAFNVNSQALAFQ